MAAAVFLLGGCSDEGTPEPNQAPSFACLEARSTLALNEGSPVGVARSNIDSVIASENITLEQITFYRNLRSALDGLSDSDPVGARLDNVPCSLTE